MTGLEAFILGIVEGISEFLPISSTGHLILASKLLAIPDSDFLKTFEISIQLGAILAVAALYWRSFLNIETLKKVAAGFLPTAIIGFVLYKIIKSLLLGNTMVVIWALAIGGIILILFEYFHGERSDATGTVESISYKQAAIIGLCQSIAVIPGVSRSAATIVGGLALGLKRSTIVEYSFLLAVPTMLAATALDLLKNYSAFSHNDFGTLAIGFIVSAIVALVSVKFLLSYVQKYSFVAFGVYRIMVAILFVLLIQ